MTHAIYRVNLKRSEYVQVDIKSDVPLTMSEILQKSAEQSNREFGQMDEAEIVALDISVTVSYQDGKAA